MCDFNVFTFLCDKWAIESNIKCWEVKIGHGPWATTDWKQLFEFESLLHSATVLNTLPPKHFQNQVSLPTKLNGENQLFPRWKRKIRTTDWVLTARLHSQNGPSLKETQLTQLQSFRFSEYNFNSRIHIVNPSQVFALCMTQLVLNLIGSFQCPVGVDLRKPLFLQVFEKSSKYTPEKKHIGLQYPKLDLVWGWFGVA